MRVIAPGALSSPSGPGGVVTMRPSHCHTRRARASSAAETRSYGRSLKFDVGRGASQRGVCRPRSPSMHAQLASIVFVSTAALVLAPPSSAQLSNPVIGAKEARLFSSPAQIQEQLGTAVAIDDVRAVCGLSQYDAA